MGESVCGRGQNWTGLRLRQILEAWSDCGCNAARVFPFDSALAAGRESIAVRVPASIVKLRGQPRRQETALESRSLTIPSGADFHISAASEKELKKLRPLNRLEVPEEIRKVFDAHENEPDKDNQPNLNALAPGETFLAAFHLLFAMERHP